VFGPNGKRPGGCGWRLIHPTAIGNAPKTLETSPSPALSSVLVGFGPTTQGSTDLGASGAVGPRARPWPSVMVRR
jgi:hypothetical protein